MNDDDNYRGYDLWVEGRRIGAHIINRWPADALKVVSERPATCRSVDACRHYVRLTARRKLTGVHVYVNGKRQRNTNVLSDTLTESIRTTVPFKIGQRNKTSPLAGGTIHDVRVYARQLPDNEEVASLARSSLSAIVAAPPEKKRSPARPR